MAGGVHPLLAARAADTALPEAFVLAWALLLAAMGDAGQEQRRRLGLTCGSVDRWAKHPSVLMCLSLSDRSVQR